jgi:hypothetical protein
MAISALPNALTLSQIQRAMQALDVNGDNRISAAEIGFPPSQIQQMNGGAAGDSVELSKAAMSLNAGMVKLSFSGNYRAAREAAQSLDANRNGVIDASEVALSDGLKQEITGSTAKPVGVQDLANAFWKGTVTFGRELRLF